MVWLSSFGVGHTLAGLNDQADPTARPRLRTARPTACRRGNPTIRRAEVAAFVHQATRGREWVHRTAVISD